MGNDIKIFQLAGGDVRELAGQAVQIEKSLQSLFEENLEALLGVRFLKTEHFTGIEHGGRIDTLGIDEDGSPVIIEYKRAVNENVINQGLFYLDWMMDHKKDFEWLVLERLGAEAAKNVDWSGPRLICIAGDFTRYDEHAAKQIAKNIELLRYRRYGNELLMIELVYVPNYSKKTIPPALSAVNAPKESADSDPYQSQRINYRISQMNGELRDLFEAVYQYLQSLGDDIQIKEQKFYIAFKRIKNFACLEVYPQTKVVQLHLKVDPETIQLEEGFTRDVTDVGHFGTGDLQVTLRTMSDFQRAQPLFVKSYENS